MMNRDIFSPIAYHAKSFHDIEKDSFHELCEYIDYERQQHVPEDNCISIMIEELEHHIYLLRKMNKLKEELQLEELEHHIYSLRKKNKLKLKVELLLKNMKEFVNFTIRNRVCLSKLKKRMNEFSPEVEIFLNQFNKIILDENNDESFDSKVENFINNLDYNQYKDQMMKEKNKIRSRIEKNRESLRTYTESLLKQHSDFTVMRFEIAFFFNDNNTEAFFQHYLKFKSEFFYNLIKVDFKDDIVGYIWKFQPQQEDKMIACHVVLFLREMNFSEEKKKDLISKRIKHVESEWARVTDNTGKFWHCDAQFKYRSTVSDLQALSCKLDTIVNYLINPDYYIRLKLPKGVRSYGRSEEMVIPPKNKRM